MISYIPSSAAVWVPMVGWAWVLTLNMGRMEDILLSTHCKQQQKLVLSHRSVPGLDLDSKFVATLLDSTHLVIA